MAHEKPATVASTFSYGNKTYSIFSSGSVGASSQGDAETSIDSRGQRVELKEGSAEDFGAVEASSMQFESRKSKPFSISKNDKHSHSSEFSYMPSSGSRDPTPPTIPPLSSSDKVAFSQYDELPSLESVASPRGFSQRSARKGLQLESPRRLKTLSNKSSNSAWQELLWREQQQSIQSSTVAFLSRSADLPSTFSLSSSWTPQAPTQDLTRSFSPSTPRDPKLGYLQEIHLKQMEQQASFLKQLSDAPIHRTHENVDNHGLGTEELEKHAEAFENERLNVEQDVLSKIAAIEKQRDLEAELDTQLDMERHIERENRASSWQQDSYLLETLPNSVKSSPTNSVEALKQNDERESMREERLAEVNTARSREEKAATVLLDRHTPMVWKQFFFVSICFMGIFVKDCVALFACRVQSLDKVEARSRRKKPKARSPCRLSNLL